MTKLQAMWYFFIHCLAHFSPPMTVRCFPIFRAFLFHRLGVRLCVSFFRITMELSLQPLDFQPAVLALMCFSPMESTSGPFDGAISRLINL